MTPGEQPTRHMVNDPEPALGQGGIHRIRPQDFGSRGFGDIGNLPVTRDAAQRQKIMPVRATLIAVVDIVSQINQTLRQQPDLLDQLAARGDFGSFAGIDEPARHRQAPRPRRSRVEYRGP